MDPMLKAAHLASVLTAADGSCLYWAFAGSSGRLPPDAIMHSPFDRNNEHEAAGAAMAWMTMTRERVVKYIENHQQTFRNNTELWQEWQIARRRTRSSNNATELRFDSDESRKHLDVTKWGGCAQIRALAGVHGEDIVVIPTSSTPMLHVQIYMADGETDVQCILWTD